MDTTLIIEIVSRYVPGGPLAAQSLRNFETLKGALESLARTEESVFTAGQELIRLKDFGVSTEDDFTAYDTLRANLYAAQFGWYTLLKNTVGAIDSRAARQIPAPQMLPRVAPPSRVFRAKQPIRFATFPAIASRQVAVAPPGASSSSSSSPGTEGLGAVQVGWAAAAIAIIAALALMVLYVYIVGAAVEEIARVAIVEKQTEQYRELLRARTAAYQTCLNGSEQQYSDCVAAGGVPDVCRSTIIAQCLDAAGVLIPTPEDAGIRPPELSSNNPYKWVLVGAGGLLALIVGTLAYARFGGGAPRSMRGVARGPRALRGAKRVFDLDGPSEYNLEVDED